jgi:TonB family protein
MKNLFTYFLTLCLTLTGMAVYAQPGKSPLPPDTAVYSVPTTAEIMPRFPGGDAALRQHIKGHLNRSTVKREGLAEVSFIIGNTGNVRNIKMIRKLGKAHDSVVVRLVRSMPPWTPGKANGRAVAVRYHLPVNFALPMDTAAARVEKRDVSFHGDTDGENLLTDPVMPEPSVYNYVEQMPEFPGGADSMLRFMQRNLVYPPMAIENAIEGKVVVSFVVDADGRTKDVSILKKLGWGCDEAAIQLIRKMPMWKPGKQNGKKVAVKYNLPVTFRLPSPALPGNDIVKPDINQLKDEPAEPSFFVSAEVMPKFPGGDDSMVSFIKRYLVYPKQAIENGIEGKVVLSFVVGTDGTLSDIQILKTPGFGCSEAAITVIRRMPAWSPGKQNGRAVPVKLHLPVTFILPQKKEHPKDVVQDEMPPQPDNYRTGMEERIYLAAEIMPRFPGGDDSLLAFMHRNLDYPTIQSANPTEGRVIVTFVVGMDGKLSDIRVLKSLGVGFDEEAINLIKKMPAWKPGMQNGRPVAIRYNLPVTFKLK